jgi:hypothetical protein
MLSILAATVPTNLSAQTRLRDPQQSVFAAFPDADAFQAIIRNIDPQARQRIEGRLPFRVHLDELGEHTVYVALRKRLPLGMVYVVSEEDAFGFTEVRWAITLDLRLSGFEFQRTRSQQRETIEGSEFARLLHGKSMSDLARMLDDDGTLEDSVRGVPPGGEELATALVRSALKAMAVVDEVWVTEVVKLHDLAVGIRAFPSGVRFIRLWPPVRAADEAPPPELTDIQYVVRAYGRESRELGAVAQIRGAVPATTLSWIVDETGRIVRLEAPTEAPPQLRSACLDAVGETVENASRRKGEIGRSARMLLRVLRGDVPRQQEAEPPR